MGEPLDEQYLRWLYHQVASLRFKNPARTYWSLVKQLHCKPFVWLVPNDDNRVEDGRDLRYEFIKECDVEADEEWLSLECSMLEMLIGLSRRLAFESKGSARDWFWEMIENMDLKQLNDFYYDSEAPEQVDRAMDNVIWRTYNSDGSGGLFPLQNPEEDQTDVELWYQLSSYLAERQLV